MRRHIPWGETCSHMGVSAPRPWTCPMCDHENKRYLSQCWECGTRRPHEYSGRYKLGIVNLASHKVDPKTVTV